MLAVFLGAEVVFVLASVLVVLPFAVAGFGIDDDGRLPGTALVVAVTVPVVLAALVVLAGVALFGGGDRLRRVRRELAWHGNWRHVGIGAAIGGAGLALTMPAALLWAHIVGLDEASSALGEVFADRTLGWSAAIAVFLAVWLVAPLCEEIMFRGALWRSLQHWGWNRWVILVVTTVAFSIAHFELLRSPLLLVIAIPIGLARLFTGNLVAAVVAHQVNNLFPAVSLLLTTTGVVAV
ncbi:CPBP family intramembrane metalloprotease [Haloechinothrix sp. LS1_15]|nr:CPBP family intramembrane metalloprotease [Haloechinothrix sp. LS1_15]